jgi:hypothetical protein
MKHIPSLSFTTNVTILVQVPLELVTTTRPSYRWFNISSESNFDSVFFTPFLGIPWRAPNGSEFSRWIWISFFVLRCASGVFSGSHCIVLMYVYMNLLRNSECRSYRKMGDQSVILMHVLCSQLHTPLWVLKKKLQATYLYWLKHGRIVLILGGRKGSCDPTHRDSSSN